MKVLVIEDEHLAAARLESMIRKVLPEADILPNIDTVYEAVDYLQTHEHPELAFFDIQLADALSFEIFEEVDIQFPVIFTTAYNEYALKAFKVNSIDYLLKPIDLQELEAAIQKFKRLNKPGSNSPSDKELFRQVMKALNKKEYRSRFVVKSGEHLHSINVSTVSCFYSENKLSFIHLKNGRYFIIDDSIDSIEILVDPTQFFRISRKYLINLDAISEILSHSNSRLRLSLTGRKDESVIVSREKVPEFKAWLER